MHEPSALWEQWQNPGKPEKPKHNHTAKAFKGVETVRWWVRGELEIFLTWVSKEMNDDFVRRMKRKSSWWVQPSVFLFCKQFRLPSCNSYDWLTVGGWRRKSILWWIIRQLEHRTAGWPQSADQAPLRIGFCWGLSPWQLTVAFQSVFTCPSSRVRHPSSGDDCQRTTIKSQVSSSTLRLLGVNWTQVVSLRRNHLYSLSHTISPLLPFL